MPCYQPLWAIPDINPRTGKPYLTKNGKTKYHIFGSEKPLLDDPHLITIPCGKCIGCRLEYSRQWANRCLLEMKEHDSAYFVTLTYNDWHVPISHYIDQTTGEFCDVQTLRKRDYQLFMKRLRKAFPDQQIRFYAAGEYGPKTYRPHYHAILFGLKLDDLEPYGMSDQNYPYYWSRSLQKVWDDGENLQNLYEKVEKKPLQVYQNVLQYIQGCKESITPLTSRGFVLVANVSWETCAYVARYVTKKLTGEVASFYKEHNIEPPFSLMSRKPGIGRGYYDSNLDSLYDYDYINVSTRQGGVKFRPPRYFNRLLETDNPELSEKLRETRKNLAKEISRCKLSQTDKRYMNMLDTEEEVKQEAVKTLRRSQL